MPVSKTGSVTSFRFGENDPLIFLEMWGADPIVHGQEARPPQNLDYGRAFYY